MTATLERTETLEESKQRFIATLREAVRQYLAELAVLVDVSKLSLADAESDFDWEVPVAQEQLYEISERLVEVSFEINERFGIKFSTLAIGV